MTDADREALRNHYDGVINFVIDRLPITVARRHILAKLDAARLLTLSELSKADKTPAELRSKSAGPSKVVKAF